MKPVVLFISIILLLTLAAQAQTDSLGFHKHITPEGDTVFSYYLRDVIIRPPRTFNNDKDYKEYWRTVYNFRKVYPYAETAREKLTEMNKQFLNLTNEKEKKAYVKKVEKEMFDEFEGPLRKLSRSQGRMLIKLIDREVGESSFEVIKELKGGVSAFFWQSIARLFGSNLKSRYDKYGEDALLEELIEMYQDGSFESLYFSMFYLGQTKFSIPPRPSK